MLLFLNEPGDPLFVVQNLSRKKINSQKVKFDKNDLQSMPFRRISVCQVCSVFLGIVIMNDKNNLTKRTNGKSVASLNAVI